MNTLISTLTKYFRLPNIFLMFVVILTSSCTKHIPVARHLSGTYSINTKNIRLRTLQDDSTSFHLNPPTHMYLFYDSIHENQAYYTIYASSYMYGLCKYNVDESIVRFEFGYPDWASKKIKRIYPEEGATYDVLCEQVKDFELPIWHITENTVDTSKIFGRIELHIEKNGDFKLGGYSYLLLLNSEILGKLEIIDPEAPVLRRQKKPFFYKFSKIGEFFRKNIKEYIIKNILRYAVVSRQ